MSTQKNSKKDQTTVTFPAPEKELLSTKETALFLERAELTIRHMAYLGIIKPIKLRGRCYYRKSILIHWIILGRPFSKNANRISARVIPMYPEKSATVLNAI